MHACRHTGHMSHVMYVLPLSSPESVSIGLEKGVHVLGRGRKSPYRSKKEGIFIVISITPKKANKLRTIQTM